MNTLSLTCPINTLGYGLASWNIFKHLVHNNIKVALFPISSIEISDKKDTPLLNEAVKNAQFFDVNAPSLRIWHQHDMAQHIGKGLHIGFPIFELDNFTELELHHLRSLDIILVCSEWAKKIVRQYIPDADVQVVPLGVDRTIFNEDVEHKLKSLVNPKDKFIFLNIGKWEKRKGHDILPRILAEAFKSTDDVELWMMPHNPFLNEQQVYEWGALHAHSELGKKIKILPRLRTQEEVAQIIASVDCGIFPSRAEGWNLELLEMMSQGKPVIATNYSAHTEFCTNENTYLVEIEDLEKAYDGKWFSGQGNWAELEDEQIGQFAQHMKNVFQKGHGQVNSPGISTAHEFSWDNTVNKLLEGIGIEANV